MLDIAPPPKSAGSGLAPLVVAGLFVALALAAFAFWFRQRKRKL